MLSGFHSFVQVDAKPASLEDLAPVAFSGHAHFTAIQVRNGKIRGLDLHLSRLQRASLKIFNQKISERHVLSCLRTAIKDGREDMSLMVTVYSSSGEFTPPEADAMLKLMISTAAPSNGPAGPLALKSYNYERPLAEVKHVGEIAKTYYLRKAVQAGFDDATFVDNKGRISECSIWNIAFWDGTSVIWPKAEILTGTTMSILQRQLEKFGTQQREEEVRLEDVAGMKGAVVMNSWTPGVMVSKIDSVVLPDAPEFYGLLQEAFTAEPLVFP